MNRREMLELAVATVMTGGRVMAETGERSYEGASISVRLVEERPGVTSVYLTEHGHANYVIVEAFYWATFGGNRVMFHKETTAPLMRGVVVGAELLMPASSIVFVRVKEMKLVTTSQFGDPTLLIGREP